MFGFYKFVCVFLYLFLSSVMLYHRLVRRWIKFSIGFFVLYALGSYVFFGASPVSLPQDYAELLPNFLFFFGCIFCIGLALYKQLTWGQTFGLLACYLFFVFLLAFIIGKNVEIVREASIREFLFSAPFVLLVVGIPIVAGYCFYKEWCLWEAIGACTTYCFTMVLVIIAMCSLFHRPIYDLSPGIRALLEIGSLLLPLIGLPALLGYCLWQQLTLRQSIGAIIVFSSATIGLVGIVYLTIGYQIVGIVFADKP